MLLVMDVGNTNTSLGVFEGETLVYHWRLTTERARTVDEYGVHARNLFALAGLDFKAITAAAIASVVPQLNHTLKRMCEVYLHLSPLFIDHASETGLTILYDPPSDVGADRIVDAVAAVHKYGAPCVVVDFGTATNFEVIDEGGRYLGGVLTPGISISSDALFARAARLPRVAIERPQKVIGTSTVGAIQSGLYYGYAGLVDGILRRMIEELGRQPRVVATGGLAPLIATASEYIEVVDRTLTLDGLRLVYGMNRQGARREGAGDGGGRRGDGEADLQRHDDDHRAAARAGRRRDPCGAAGGLNRGRVGAGVGARLPAAGDARAARLD